MSTVATPSPTHRERELLGQTVVVIGGSAGIGFETARRARAEGAKVTLTGRNAERLRHAASEVDALSTVAFDAADMEFAKIRDLIGEHLSKALYVTRNAANKVRPGETLIFVGGTGGRRPAIGMSIVGAVTATLPALTANLAHEIGPVRVNQLRRTLPIGRVVGPADVAALAVHIMTNTALTGATFDIDGGRQFVAA